MINRELGLRIAHHEPFLFPLDGIRDWNRLYGPRGFYQYQCVVPREAGSAPIREMLTRSTVGRRFGVGSAENLRRSLAAGLLSFARPGVTLALDFQNRAGIENLFERLDAIVAQQEAAFIRQGRAHAARDVRGGLSALGEVRVTATRA